MGPKRPKSADPPAARPPKLPSWPPWIHRVYQLLQDTTSALPKNAPPPAKLPQGIPEPPQLDDPRGRHLRSWTYRHSEAGVRATSFRPDRHTIVVHGRPVQVPDSVSCLRGIAFACVCKSGPSACLLSVFLTGAGFVLCSLFSTEALVMTYLQAPPEEWAPYLSYALRPLRPVCLAGVSARHWPGE